MTDQELTQILTPKEYIALGDCHYVNEDYNDAIDAYGAGIALFEGEKAVSNKIEALSHKSLALYKLERYAESLEDAQEAINLISTAPTGIRKGTPERCHARAGHASMALEQFDSAKDFFQHAAQLASLNHRKVSQEEFDGLVATCVQKLNQPVVTNQPVTQVKNDRENAKILLENAKILLEEKNTSEAVVSESIDGTIESAEKAETAPEEEKPKRVRPYASHKDWNAIERQIIEEEKAEKAPDKIDMNDFFKQIFADSDDDTRRAMVKSMQTSGGTTLTTNWGEAKDKDYEKERTAPDGCEWKTWDGKKVPMKKN